MNCNYKKCEYAKGKTCGITNIYEPKICLIPKDRLEALDICYNCKYWIGGGDYGLSCKKDYYLATTNGFIKACELFDWK